MQSKSTKRNTPEHDSYFDKDASIQNSKIIAETPTKVKESRKNILTWMK